MNNEDAKNVLFVIGNGYDLYHGLPTRFSDFFNIIDNFDIICNGKEKEIEELSKEDINKYKLVREFYDYYIKNGLKNEILLEIKKYLHKTKNEFDNKLFEYWKEVKELKNGKKLEDIEWNDFEMILTELLLIISNAYKENNIKELIEVQEKREKIKPFLNPKANYENKINIETKEDIIVKLFIKNNDTLKWLAEKEVIDNIYKWFKEFRIIFNFYISYYVNRCNVEVFSLQIDQIIKNEENKILSFNYSDYNKYSLQQRDDKNVIYIHGKASGDNYTNKDMYYCNNDIVVGIPDKTFNDPKYIEFQKFFQRIMFKTKNVGIDDIRGCNKAYFFGHSMHKLDESILKLIFDNVGANMIAPHIVIYYKDDFDKKKKIINILEWYDKEIFINRMASKEIVFEELQKPIKYSLLYKDLVLPKRGE